MSYCIETRQLYTQNPEKSAQLIGRVYVSYDQYHHSEWSSLGGNLAAWGRDMHFLEGEPSGWGCVSEGSWHISHHSAPPSGWMTIFFFLGLLLQHMEVPRLVIKLELQLPAYATVIATWDLSHICDLSHSSQQHWILNPLSEARDRTCNLVVPSWMVSAVPRRELQEYFW